MKLFIFSKNSLKTSEEILYGNALQLKLLLVCMILALLEIRNKLMAVILSERRARRVNSFRFSESPRLRWPTTLERRVHEGIARQFPHILVSFLDLQWHDLCKYFLQHVCLLQAKISVVRMSSRQMKHRSNSSSGGILSCLRLRLTCDMFVVECERVFSFWVILYGLFVSFLKIKMTKRGMGYPPEWIFLKICLHFGFVKFSLVI